MLNIVKFALLSARFCLIPLKNVGHCSDRKLSLLWISLILLMLVTFKLFSVGLGYSLLQGYFSPPVNIQVLQGLTKCSTCAMRSLSLSLMSVKTQITLGPVWLLELFSLYTPKNFFFVRSFTLHLYRFLFSQRLKGTHGQISGALS